MTRRARFTKSEMDRLFSAAKRNGVHVRIVPTKDSFIAEMIEPDHRIAGKNRDEPIVKDEEIIL